MTPETTPWLCYWNGNPISAQQARGRAKSRNPDACEGTHPSRQHPWLYQHGQAPALLPPSPFPSWGTDRHTAPLLPWHCWLSCPGEAVVAYPVIPRKAAHGQKQPQSQAGPQPTLPACNNCDTQSQEPSTDWTSGLQSHQPWQKPTHRFPEGGCYHRPMIPPKKGSGFSTSRSCLLVIKKAIYQRVTGCWLCHATLSDMKFSLFLLVHLAEHGEASGTEPTLCLALAAQDWKHGLILPGKAVSAGWGTGREMGEKGWHGSPYSTATMRALWCRVTYPCPHPTLVQKHSHLIIPIPTAPKRALSKSHTKSPHTIFIAFLSFPKQLQIWIHLWASHICSLPALLRMTSFAHKAGHIDRVAEAGLELKEEQSSQNDRKKHETQKNLPGKTLQTTSSATWALLLRHIWLQTH